MPLETEECTKVSLPTKNADVADAVAAGLEEDEIAGFELAALDLLPETCHFLGCAREFHTENPVVHEAHKT